LKGTKAERIYSLNLALFFSVVSNNVTQDARSEIDEYAESLRSADKEFWQFRYDDTLARYLCKIAIVYSKDISEKTLNVITNRFEKAESKSKFDESVQETREIIDDIRERVLLKSAN